MLWHCWLGVKKSIQLVKHWMMSCWRDYLSGVRCKWSAYGPADATGIPSSLASLGIQNGLTFLVPPYTACTGKQAITLVSVLTIQLQVKLIQTLNANRYVVSPVQNAQQHVDTIWPDQANTAKLNGQQPWRWYCYHCVQEDELTKPVNGMQCCYQYLQ